MKKKTVYDVSFYPDHLRLFRVWLIAQPRLVLSADGGRDRAERTAHAENHEDA